MHRTHALAALLLLVLTGCPGTSTSSSGGDSHTCPHCQCAGRVIEDYCDPKTGYYACGCDNTPTGPDGGADRCANFSCQCAPPAVLIESRCDATAAICRCGAADAGYAASSSASGASAPGSSAGGTSASAAASGSSL